MLHYDAYSRAGVSLSGVSARTSLRLEPLLLYMHNVNVILMGVEAILSQWSLPLGLSVLYFRPVSA